MLVLPLTMFEILSEDFYWKNSIEVFFINHMFGQESRNKTKHNFWRSLLINIKCLIFIVNCKTNLHRPLTTLQSLHVTVRRLLYKSSPKVFFWKLNICKTLINCKTKMFIKLKCLSEKTSIEIFFIFFVTKKS